MSVEFSADEVFAMAEQIERNGGRFYRKAAEKAEGEAKEILVRFAVMEDEHERTFQALRAELPDEARRPLVFDPEGDLGLYVNAMADGYVFNVREDPSTTLTGDETVEELFEVALGREKEAVVFYVGLKAAVPAEVGQDRIDRIIREELGHIGILSRQLAMRR
ncbi:MAG: rubrerythrin [Armatimonadetes bacterium]|nr:rubrerythrin [Armatimonadota bacterium]